MYTEADHAFMAQALRLAEKGLYTTTPNPRVGCVIVRDGKVVGSGWHERAGESHAEIHALTQTGELAQGGAGSSTRPARAAAAHRGPAKDRRRPGGQDRAQQWGQPVDHRRGCATRCAPVARPFLCG